MAYIHCGHESNVYTQNLEIIVIFLVCTDISNNTYLLYANITDITAMCISHNALLDYSRIFILNKHSDSGTLVNPFTANPIKALHFAIWV